MRQDSHLNVYIAGDSLSPRQRVQVQAQVDSALRALPAWTLDLLRAALDGAGAPNFPIIVEPVPSDAGAGDDPLPLSLGRMDGRPAAYLRPRLAGARIEWPRDRRYLVAKAAAYLCLPPLGDAAFWRRWAEAAAADRLREHSSAADGAWAAASDRELLIEMFAAYALTPEHPRWRELGAVRAFLEGWGGGSLRSP